MRAMPAIALAAAVVLAPAVADAGPGAVSADCRRKVAAALLETMRASGKVEAPRRAAAGKALAAVGDPRPVLHDVDERHRVAPAEAVVLGQPGDHLARLRVGAIAAGVRLVDELLRGLAGLLLDRVEVGLEGHRRSPGGRGGVAVHCVRPAAGPELIAPTFDRPMTSPGPLPTLGA